MTFHSSPETDSIANAIALVGAGTDPLPPEKARELRDLAASMLLSQPRESLRIADALIQTVERTSAEPKSRAMAWRCLAEAETYLGRLREARQSYEKACDFASRGKLDSLLGEILVGRIGVLTALGDSDGGKWIVKADRLLQRSDNIEYRAKLHMNLGSAAYHQETYEDAHREYSLARQLFSELGRRDPIVVSLLVNLGIACTELFRLKEARSILAEAEGLADEMNQGHLAAHARYGLSFIDVAEGQFRSALDLLERAESAFAEVGASDLLATTRLTQAEIHLELGLPEEALRLSEEATLLFVEQEKDIDALLARRTHGLCLRRLRRLRAAERILSELGDEFRRRQIWPRYHQVLLDRAEISILRGRFEQAEDLARKAKRGLSRQRQSDVPDPREAMARIRLAEAQSGRGRHRQGERSLSPVLSARGGYPLALRRRLLTDAGRLARRRGDLDQARSLLDEAIADVEQQRLLIPGTEFRAAAFEEQSDSYRERILCELEQVDGTDPASIETVFCLWQIARARGFEERRSEPDREVPTELREARRRLAALTQRVENRTYARAPVDELTDLAAQVVEMERDVLNQHRRWETKSGQVTRIPTPVTIEALQNSLRPDECFAEFFVGSDHVFVLLVQSGAAEVKQLSAEVAELVKWIGDLVFQIDSFAQLQGAGLANQEFLQRQTQNLLGQIDDALLRPLDEWVDGKQLLLIPHRELHLIPFEAVFLSREDGGGEALTGRVVVRRISTARQFLARRREAADTHPSDQKPEVRRAVTLIGNVENGPPLVAEEIKSIAEQLRGQSPDILLDPTAEEVRHALQNTRIAHLSTHGSFRGDNPLLSRLSFRDGALFLSDLLAEKLPCDLVVLSTCESGCAFSGNGEDLVGLSYGFLSAGARTLVASLWRVDDAATAALMHAFYLELDRGTTDGAGSDESIDPAIALSRARASIRARWPHPFFWGAFTLYGD